MARVRDMEKQREYKRAHYQRNKERLIKEAHERRVKVRDWIFEYKKTLKCERCPENHPACLQFHHLNPDEKDINVSSAAERGWSIERTKQEIDKCIVLCANCHAKLHYDERQEQQE